MSNRPEITTVLSISTEKYITPHGDPRIYWAKEVTFDYATSNAVRVDYMKFKPVNNTVSGIEKGDFYCYEVKSSVEDFHSKNGHNFIGDFNYYVMPEDVYEKVKDEIPYKVGVLVPEKKNQNKRVCPLCGKEYDGVPALSRKDNETLICPECGTREAIDAALSVPEFSAGMTEQEKEEYKENVIRKIHENI